jgi:hypothetical protein
MDNERTTNPNDPAGVFDDMSNALIEILGLAASRRELARTAAAAPPDPDLDWSGMLAAGMARGARILEADAFYAAIVDILNRTGITERANASIESGLDDIERHANGR